MPETRATREKTGQTRARDVDHAVFARSDPKAIAAALKRSAEASHRRRTTPFRSAMATLSFFINRAGQDLDPGQKRVLEQAKDELRAAFGRAPKT